jgi:protein SCO1
MTSRIEFRAESRGLPRRARSPAVAICRPDPAEALAGPMRVWLLALVCLLTLLAASPTLGQRKEETPADLREVGVTEHRDQQIPLDLEFVDSKGRKVTLAEYFDGQLPVILTLNYSDCPMLCSLQLNGLFDGLKRVAWDMGEQYRMLTVSIDPAETFERAEMTRQNYLRNYGRPGVGEGYASLTGEQAAIKRLADTVGFHYRYVPSTGEYAHSAVTMICTPDGRLSKYLYGVEYDPQTLRLSMLEASEGKIGSPMDQLLLFCFMYDPAAGKYGPSAMKLMRLGAVTMVLVVGGVLLVYWRRESGRDDRAEVVHP